MKPTLLLVILSLALASCAPASQTPEIPAINETSKPLSPSPTPEAPTAVPLNVSPDVKAVLDAQKAPYKVDAHGNAVVDLQDTATQEKIVLNKITDTKTNDGLAKDIVTGFDKDGNRLIFVENYGWVKDIDPGTPEKRTQVPYEWFGNGAINTIAALHYQDHPTIPPAAIDVPWWLQAGSNGPLREINLTRIPLDNSKLIKFDGKTKPFGDITLWVEFPMNGKSFVSAVQPNNNPDKEHGKPDQKINLPFTFDADRLDQTGPNIDDIKDFIINNKMSLAAFLEPDASKPSLSKFHPLLAGIDNVFSTPNLQTPGAQISLFSVIEQAGLANTFKIIDSGSKIPENQRDTRVSVLPTGLAFEPLTSWLVHFPWGTFNNQP